MNPHSRSEPGSASDGNRHLEKHKGCSLALYSSFSSVSLSRVCQDYPLMPLIIKRPLCCWAGENSGCQTRGFSEWGLSSLDTQPPHLGLAMPNKGWHHSGPIMLCLLWSAPLTLEHSQVNDPKADTHKLSLSRHSSVPIPVGAQQVFVEWMNKLLTELM